MNIQPSPITTCDSRSSSCESIPRISPLPDTPAFQDCLDMESCDMSIDTLAAMLRQEFDYTPAASAPCCGLQPLADALAPHQQLPVSFPEWRSKICDWSYRVVDHFHYDREVVGVAMNLFDRYSALQKASEDAAGGFCGGTVRSEPTYKMTLERETSSSSTSSYMTSPRSIKSCYSDDSSSSLTSAEEEESRRYQLGAMTALFLGIKLHAEAGSDEEDYGHESYSRCSRRRKRRMKLMSFVELSRGQFHPADIAEMERFMLSTLRWRVNPPTPTAFVGYLLKLLPTTNIAQQDLVLHVLHELSRYLTELSVCLTDVSTLYRPSWVAYSAILLSMETIKVDVLPLAVREAFFTSAARISSQGWDGRALAPDRKAVNYLMGRIRTSFMPEMILDATVTPLPSDMGSQSSRESRQGHPIAIARDAGLLNPEVFRGLSSEGDPMTLTPSPSDEEDLSSKDSSGHRRYQSAKSVMDDVNSWESTHHPAAWAHPCTY
mmetsp:Transcript_25200/g.55931  ORF Transcript_25200/g.55931 Transcript_25200/m.55931 type:complete len:491 (+) Transcript_25200:438-1910(+)